jgi:hypothetical protein
MVSGAACHEPDATDAPEDGALRPWSCLEAAPKGAFPVDWPWIQDVQTRWFTGSPWPWAVVQCTRQGDAGIVTSRQRYAMRALIAAQVALGVRAPDAQAVPPPTWRLQQVPSLVAGTYCGGEPQDERGLVLDLNGGCRGCTARAPRLLP